MSQKHVSILGIGTELTSGQILNRNACWISKKLAEVGIQTSGHWTVPDDRPLIRQLLQLSSEVSEIIFVTGGLGPTSDDFTREMIAEFSGLKLEWHEQSWIDVCKRLSDRGIKAKEIQKQQCYYPKGAKILPNSAGTAHGFIVETKNLKLIILPGPPKEIEAIWKDHLADWVEAEFQGLDPWITRSWDTIGVVESQIAELTAECLAGTDFEIGYRVHIPYVEVKVSYHKSQSKQADPWIKKLDANLSSVTALRDGKDATQLLAQQLERFQSCHLNDQVSGSYLISRLIPLMGPQLKNKNFEFSTSNSRTENNPVLRLGLSWINSESATAMISYRGYSQKTEFQSAYKSQLLRERDQQYFAELAALFWTAELAKL